VARGGLSKSVDIKGVIEDGTYDSRRNFKIREEMDIEPIIRVKRNAVKRLRRCPAEGRP